MCDYCRDQSLHCSKKSSVIALWCRSAHRSSRAQQPPQTFSVGNTNAFFASWVVQWILRSTTFTIILAPVYRGVNHWGWEAVATQVHQLCSLRSTSNCLGKGSANSLVSFWVDLPCSCHFQIVRRIRRRSV